MHERSAEEDQPPKGARVREAEADVRGALLDVCRGTVPSAIADAEPGSRVDEAFLTRVRLHRIAPLAQLLLREQRPDLATALRPDRDFARATHLRSLLVLAGLDELFDGLAWAVFKGPVLSETAHPAPGLRLYTDVDVLVDPNELREAVRRLVAAGWRTRNAPRHHRLAATPGEMSWQAPTGIVVDLHWTLINGADRRRRHDIRATSLLARRRRVRLGLARVPVLGDTDALAQVCLHAGLSGAHRLLWLLDVDRSVPTDDRWPALVDRARRWRAEAAVGVALARAHRYLGTEVPDGLWGSLGLSRTTAWVLAGADHLAPITARQREAALGRLVARAARPGGLATVGVTVRKLALAAWNRGPGTPGPVRSEPSDRADAADRDWFLAAVERESAGIRR